MNKQIAGTELEGKSLEEIVMASWNNGSPTPVFNNAAQVRLQVVSQWEGQ
jgi:Fe-Mn family superoxide dismutase